MFKVSALFSVSGSWVSPVTVAVLVRSGPDVGVTTIVTVTVSSITMSRRSQITSPPEGAGQVPAVVLTEPIATFVGRVSVSVTVAAVDGPWLVTARV